MILNKGRFQSTIHTSNPEELKNLQCGQWINYNGVLGRYAGIANGCSWIAWSQTAKKRFSTFAKAFKESYEHRSEKTSNARSARLHTNA